ncbi:hypothetical protein Sbal625DRAFT_4155 [Shewanella baltica OS625]|nr:hypothetical protein Sbal625DRAFT_4155 [Shewanella baltica OS625]
MNAKMMELMQNGEQNSPHFFIVGYDSENDIAQKQCYFIDSAINIERARAKCLESANRYPIVRIKDLQGQFV